MSSLLCFSPFTHIALSFVAWFTPPLFLLNTEEVILVSVNICLGSVLVNDGENEFCHGNKA